MTRSLEVKSVFIDHEIIVAEIRSKAYPESVDHIWIHLVPEVRVEFLSPIEKVEYIIEPIGFIDT